MTSMEYKAFDGTIFDNEADYLGYELQNYCEMFDEDEIPTNNLEEAFYVFFPIPQNIEYFNKIVDSYGYKTITDRTVPYTDNMMVYWDYEDDNWRILPKRKKIMNGNDITMFTELGTKALVFDEAFFIILRGEQADKDFVEHCKEAQESFEHFEPSTEDNPNYLYYDENRDMWINFKLELKGIDYLKKMFGMK